MPDKCLLCDGALMVNGHYCSEKCYRAHVDKPDHELQPLRKVKCARCNVEFVTTAPATKFCSYACRSSVNYKRNRKKIRSRAKARLAYPEVQPCEHCGTTENVQRHHQDYSRPLHIMWLCKDCHWELHRLQNASLSDINFTRQNACQPKS